MRAHSTGCTVRGVPGHSCTTQGWKAALRNPERQKSPRQQHDATSAALLPLLPNSGALAWCRCYSVPHAKEMCLKTLHVGRPGGSEQHPNSRPALGRAPCTQKHPGKRLVLGVHWAPSLCTKATYNCLRSMKPLKVQKKNTHQNEVKV